MRSAVCDYKQSQSRKTIFKHFSLSFSSEGEEEILIWQLEIALIRFLAGSWLMTYVMPW
jgi:hypothetical protein